MYLLPIPAVTRLKHDLAIAIAIAGLVSTGCYSKSSKSKSPSPSKVEMVPHESELATITLTQEASDRLGIKTVPTEQRSVQRHRVFGGEVIVPSNKSIVISAPISATVQPTSGSSIPKLGVKVKSGDALMALRPILTPERDVPTPAEQVQMAGAKASIVAAQATAMGDLQRAKADLNGARISYDRAKKLLEDRAGSQKNVDDAMALVQIATAVVNAAEDRTSQLSKLLDTLQINGNPGQVSSFLLKAPVDGIVRQLFVSENQQVVAGSPLIEVLDLNSVWVRVPVFVDLTESIDSKANGKVVRLDGGRDVTNSEQAKDQSKLRAPIEATPIDAPPTADPNSASIDLYFDVINRDAGLRPGQRVGIELPLRATNDALIVPASSIVIDIHGGAWVYAEKKPLQFERRRVAVQWMDASKAILEKGPAAGTNVVSAGAAELFGTEFGPGK